MHPFPPQKQIQEDHRTNTPSQWISPEDHTDIRNEVNRNSDVADTEYAPDAEYDDHRLGCVAGTAEDGGDTVGECQQEVKQSNDS